MKFNKLAVWLTPVLKLALILFALLAVVGAGLSSVILIKSTSGKILLLWLAIFVLVFGISWLLLKLPDNKKWNTSLLLGMLTFFAMVFALWIWQTPLQQTSDYLTFWKTTPKALAGQAIYQTDNSYFAKWAYQTGFLAYVMAIVKVFGYHIQALQVFNVIEQVLILWLTYQLAQRLFKNVGISRVSLFLLGINLEWFALNNRITNQYIALVFILLALLLLVDQKTYSWLGAGISLALANCFRPLGVIFIAGIAVFWLVYLVAQAKNGTWWKQLARLFGLIAVYFLLLTSLGAAIKASGLNEYGLSNRDSEWKFVLGLNYDSTGTYSTQVTQKFDLRENRKTMLQKEKQVTQQNIANLNENHLWLKLFIQKFFILWSNPSNTIDFSLFSQNHSFKNLRLVTFIAYGISVLELLFLLVGAIGIWFKKIDNRLYLLLLPTFAYAAAQLLIEVQGRYRIEFVPILVIVAALGVDLICRLMKKRLKV